MKTKLGVLIFVFVTAMILGTGLPALLYAGAETGGGTVWDPFVDTSSFTGTKLFGPLSVYLDVTCVPHPTKAKDPACYPCCPCDLGAATMFYTVRLTKGSGILYTLEGSTDGVCIGNIGTPGSGGQGDVIMNFLNTAVTNIFGPGHQWKLKSVNYPGASQDSLAFVADIELAVQ
jgi:hypothetical protein